MIGDVIRKSKGRLDAIELEVFRSNGRARRLYTRLGFVCTGEFRMASRNGLEEPVDGMVLPL
jgi:ribosomal protein S18 acetylase RimI-like enzyme